MSFRTARIGRSSTEEAVTLKRTAAAKNLTGLIPASVQASDPMKTTDHSALNARDSTYGESRTCTSPSSQRLSRIGKYGVCE